MLILKIFLYGFFIVYQDTLDENDVMFWNLELREHSLKIYIASTISRLPHLPQNSTASIHVFIFSCGTL